MTALCLYKRNVQKRSIKVLVLSIVTGNILWFLWVLWNSSLYSNSSHHPYSSPWASNGEPQESHQSVASCRHPFLAKQNNTWVLSISALWPVPLAFGLWGLCLAPLIYSLFFSSSPLPLTAALDPEPCPALTTPCSVQTPWTDNHFPQSPGSW